MPLSFSSLAFRAIVHIRSRTLSRHLSVFWRSESFPLDRIVQGHNFDIHVHWHYTSCLHGFASILIFLTVLPCAYAYRLFVIALPAFSFHCSWRSPLSLQHTLRSCRWAPYTRHFHVVLLGQSSRGIFVRVLWVIFGEVLERIWVFGAASEAL